MEYCSYCYRFFKNKLGLFFHNSRSVEFHQKIEDVKNGRVECEFGCKRPSTYILKNKKACCEEFSSKCPEVRRKNSAKNKGIIRPHIANNHPRGMLGKKAWNSGFTNDDYIDYFGTDKWEQICIKIGRSSKDHNYWANLPIEVQDRIRKEASEKIKLRYEFGWMPKAGRCKKIKYQTRNGDVVSLDGFWELTFAFFSDKIGLNWIRNKTRFSYTFENKERWYTPDFFIYDWECYVEVKGYYNDKSKEKIRQFTDEIKVYRKSDIKAIENDIGIKAVTLKRIYKDSQLVEYADIERIIEGCDNGIQPDLKSGD